MSDLFAGDSRDDLLCKLRAVLTEQYEIECILADALGYERGEEGGPCPGAPVIGDHTALTLAMEAARALGDLGFVRSVAKPESLAARLATLGSSGHLQVHPKED